MADDRYIFGPVPSRRLGYSLGIDLVPYKTCSYDCIYCQLGRTTEKTAARREYFPTADIIRELERKLKLRAKIDYLTFSGSGEPTLHSGLGELVRAAKRLSDLPVAVITNGSLLWNDDVQKSLAKADLIVSSLDAGTEEMYRYVNRPCPELPFRKVLDGLLDFCPKHREKIWLEVFLLAGVNVTKREIKKINAMVKKINPAKVQLNTVKRPPAESFAMGILPDAMRELADRFDGHVEVISDFNKPSDGAGMVHDMKVEILNLLKRRPCTVNDISGCLNLHRHEVMKRLDELEESDNLKVESREHDLFYSAGNNIAAAETIR